MFIVFFVFLFFCNFSIDFRFVPQCFAEVAFTNAARSVNTATAFLPGCYFTRELVQPDLN